MKGAEAAASKGAAALIFAACRAVRKTARTDPPADAIFLKSRSEFQGISVFRIEYLFPTETQMRSGSQLIKEIRSQDRGGRPLRGQRTLQAQNGDARRRRP